MNVQELIKLITAISAHSRFLSSTRTKSSKTNEIIIKHNGRVCLVLLTVLQLGNNFSILVLLRTPKVVLLQRGTYFPGTQVFRNYSSLILQSRTVENCLWTTVPLTSALSPVRSTRRIFWPSLHQQLVSNTYPQVISPDQLIIAH